jgi:hypothetical protein
MRRTFLLAIPFALACGEKDVTTDDTEVEVQDTGCDREADRDCDGWLNEDDCGPDDAYTYPGANDIPYDGKDNDCAGDGDLVDFDGDGFVSDKVEGGDDCNDGNPTIFPGAAEVCYDDIDQDCAGDLDTNDCDGDGYDGRGDEAQDCDDEDAAVNPDATEIWYDGIDQDCTGYNTSDYDADLDGDDSADHPNSDGEVGTDCNDEDPLTAGDSPELWDGQDRDCDGDVDDFSHRDAQTEWRPYSGLNDGFMGMAVQVYDDTDGDGMRNVAVAGYGTADAGYPGRVYFLTPDGTSGRPSDFALATIDGGEGEYVGTDLVNLGDMDEDGYEDWLVGSILIGGEGGAWFFEGDTLANGGTFGGANRTATLKGSDTYTGVDVAVMGDVDDDGVVELISGPGYLGEIVGGGAPAVMVYSGSDALAGGTLNPIDALAQISITKNGGMTISTDFNADGTADLLTGHNTGSIDEDGLSTGIGEFLFLDGDLIVGGSIKASDTTRVYGASPGDRVGVTAGVLEDIDGNGYPEILVSAYGHDGNGAEAGRVYFIDGSEIDGSIETQSIEDVAGTTINGTIDYGHASVSEHGGDFDNDGNEDILVHHSGDYHWVHAAYLQGQSGIESRSYILWNSDLTAGGSIDADVNSASTVFKAKEADDLFGWSSAIEDLDGDGLDDVVFGAPSAASSAGNAWTLLNNLDGQY